MYEINLKRWHFCCQNDFQSFKSVYLFLWVQCLYVFTTRHLFFLLCLYRTEIRAHAKQKLTEIMRFLHRRRITVLKKHRISSIFKATVRNFTNNMWTDSKLRTIRNYFHFKLSSKRCERLCFSPHISSLCILFIYCRLCDRGGGVCATVTSESFYHCIKKTWLALSKVCLVWICRS